MKTFFKIKISCKVREFPSSVIELLSIERHCGLMTAAIYDIMSQSQLASATNATESGSSAIVVEPVKPPSYEEINREAAVPQDPPPSYGESIRESVRESMKDYPEHYCQSIIRKY